MNKVKGDLLVLAEQGEFDVIVQGCNCFCTMGSGIARQIREKYPLSYDADLKTASGDYNKLGNYTVELSSYDNLVEHKFLIVNAYTQYGFNRAGEQKDLFEYASFEVILQKLLYNYGTKRFGLPMIGMGLAGGDPGVILSQIENFSNAVSIMGGSVTLVEFGG